MNCIVEWQIALTYRERAALATTSSGSPRRSPLSTPELILCSTRKEAEQRKAVLRAEHGDAVVVSIRELCAHPRPSQLELADNWPVQKRPK
jgi:hypothetical protein